jgi:uncharacterized protein DUF2726
LVWLYLVLVLAPALAIGYLVWNYQRKTALRNAERADRLRALVGAGRLDGATGLPETTRPTPATVLPSAPYALRERVLTPPQTLLYYLLRTGLPEHVVFAQVPLASVLEPDARLVGFARNEQSRKLLEYVLDFVIADKSLRPLSAVVLRDGTVRSAGAETVQPAGWLEAAGMKYVELDSAALPRKEAIRALVLSS